MQKLHTQFSQSALVFKFIKNIRPQQQGGLND